MGIVMVIVLILVLAAVIILIIVIFFKSTNSLCSKSKFKFILGSASHKL